MPYKWKKPRLAQRARPDRVKGQPPESELSGFVHGRSATDIEERMYRGFLSNGVTDGEIEYQPSFIAGRNMPGEIRPDYVVDQGGLIQLFFADGDYWHKSAEAKQKDQLNDSILFERLDGYAEFPIRVPGEDLQTQEEADRNIGLALRGLYAQQTR